MISTEELLKKRQELVDNYDNDGFDVEKWLAGRKEMEDIVNNCKFETPEEVANHFIAYTAVIWDYKMVGKILDCYHDHIIVHREGGGFRFGQCVYFEGTNTGWSKFGPPTGKKLTKENCMGSCECLVQIVDGRWRISEEWTTRSADTFDAIYRLDPVEA